MRRARYTLTFLFSSRQVTLWNGDYTAVQQVFVSQTGGGNFQTWYVMQLQVVMLNPTFRARSYNVIAQDSYGGSVPSTSIPLQPALCSGDVTFCRLMVPLAGSMLAPLFALLLGMAIFL